MTNVIYAYDNQPQENTEMSVASTTNEEIEAMFAKFTAMFDHIRNAFVNGAELAKRVEELSAQVSQLSQEVHQVTQQNAALQEAVNVLTQERDEARAEVQSLRWQHSQASNERDNASANFAQATEKVNALLAELENVKRDRDDAWQWSAHWEAQHKEAKGKLDVIQKALGINNGPTEYLQATG